MKKFLTLKVLRRAILLLFFFGSFYNFASLDLEARQNASSSPTEEKTVEDKKTLRTLYISRAEQREIESAKLILNLAQFLAALEMLSIVVLSYKKRKSNKKAG